MKQSNPTAYEVTQMRSYFECLTILAANNLILPFKLFQVPLSSLWRYRVSLLGITLIDHWGDFSCCFGVILLLLGVTLIGFLVWYNQFKIVWNTFKVQNLDHLVIFYNHMLLKLTLELSGSRKYTTKNC